MTSDPELYRRVHRIFEAARGVSGAEREDLLDRLCEGDAAIRKEVESLLAAFETASVPALEESAIAVVRGSLEALADDAIREPRAPESVGRYRIEGRLGAGGMGVVYRAVQESPRRTVALKVLREGHTSSERLLRFRQEAELLGRLQHPGIAQIFEAGTEDLGSGEQPYFAMEFIDGESLTAYSRACELTAARRLELLAQVCDAVHHAHGQGVIHRDLKPENILVGRDGRVKVLDFGIARAVEDTDGIATQLTTDGDLLGTLAYMAPEQLEGTSDKVTGAVDIYALGAIAFELLAGRLPFDLSGLPLASAIQLRREQDPPVLGRLRPELRGDIETIVGKALEGDPSRRYASPAALADDLRAHLEDRPISARPPSRIYKAVKFGRRHRALVLGTSATLAASLIGVAVSLTFAVRAVRSEARAAENALAARAVVAQATQEFLEQGDMPRALEAWSRVETFSGRERDVFEDALVRALLPITLPSEFGRGRCRWIDSERILCAVGEEFIVLRRGTWEVLHRIPAGVGTTLSHGDAFPFGGTPREFFDLDVDAGRIVARLGGGSDPRNAVAAGPAPQGGYQVVTREGRDGVVHLHGPDDSMVVLEPEPWGGSVFRFSPDGRRLVVATGGGQFAVHDTATGERIAERAGMRRTSCITHQITPDSSTMAAFAGSWLHLVELDTLETRSRHRVHATGPCFVGSLSPDGSHFAVNSDGRIAVTCLPTGETRWIDHAHGNVEVRVEWSPDGQTLMVRSLDTLTTLVDVEGSWVGLKAIGTEQDPRCVLFDEHTEAIQEIAISPDGRMVASLSVPDPWLRVWDVDTAKPIARIPRPTGRAGFTDWDRGYMVAFSTDGRRLVSTFATRERRRGVLVWDVVEGRAHRPKIPDELDSPSHLHLIDPFLEALGPTPAMRLGRAAFRTDDGTARATQIPVVPDTEPGRLWRSLPSTNRDFGVSPSPDGRRLALASSRQVIVHDAKSWDMLVNVPVRVSCVSWSPDGRLVAAGATSGRIHLVDPELGLDVLAIQAHRSHVFTLAWTPDGSRLVSGSLDGTIRTWHPSPTESWRAERADYERRLEAARTLDRGAWEAELEKAETVEERMVLMRVGLERSPGARPLEEASQGGEPR